MRGGWLRTLAVGLFVVMALPLLAMQCTRTDEARGIIITATNQFRTQNQQPILTTDPLLEQAAQTRADEMAQSGVMSHTRPSGGTAFDLMSAMGIPYGWAGENIGWNNYGWPATVGAIISAWENSPEHRANMLNGHYLKTGVGMAVDGKGQVWYAVLFTD